MAEATAGMEDAYTTGPDPSGSASSKKLEDAGVPRSSVPVDDVEPKDRAMVVDRFSGDDELLANLPERPVPMIDRCYTHFFAIDVDNTPFHDHYIYRHPNGLCIIGLAPSHFVFWDEGKKIKSIDFNVGRGNRQELKPTGKGKKDARFLMPNSGLCKLVFSNDSLKTVRCCVRGSLLEVNSQLSDDPSLLITKAHSEGYIGIVMPSRHDGRNQVEKELLTKEEYMKKRGDLARRR